MPERSFGRTVRYRRTKLGLSQTKLGELVGRSATTVRSWERDKSQPNDPSVLTALAAILGVDERSLFEKAGQTLPEAETSPTIEQELATLAPEPAVATDIEQVEGAEDDESVAEPEEETETERVAEPEPEPVEETEPELVAEPEPVEEPTTEPKPDGVTSKPESRPVPAYATPPPRHVVTKAIPPVHEPSYMEDSSQRQLYRVRNLATLVFLVALGITFIWAFGEGFGAIGEWWDDFFGNLRL